MKFDDREIVCEKWENPLKISGNLPQIGTPRGCHQNQTATVLATLMGLGILFFLLWKCYKFLKIPGWRGRIIAYVNRIRNASVIYYYYYYYYYDASVHFLALITVIEKIYYYYYYYYYYGASVRFLALIAGIEKIYKILSFLDFESLALRIRWEYKVWREFIRSEFDGGAVPR